MKWDEGFATFKRLLKRLFTHNLTIKIVALFFAMLCWGIMLLETEPAKSKTIDQVDVMVTGESDLYARNLVIRGDINELLKDVSVRVSTPVTNMRDFSARNVNLSVDVRSITSTGMATLTIESGVSPSSMGTIESVTPSTIEVEVDTLSSKTIPVEPYYEGTIPDGYWADTAELSVNTITIRGPKQDVQKVTKAVCRIQMNRTQSYNDAVELLLQDEGGNVIDSGLMITETPAATVRMTVLPRKTVPIDVMGALRGSDNLPANFELISAAAMPDTLDIVGEQAVLDSINSIPLEGLDISGKSESVHEKLPYILPEGNVRVLGGSGESGTVEVFVDIREKTSAKMFRDVPIQVRGLGRNLKYSLTSEVTDVTVNGRVSLVDALEWGDVKAYIDLTDLKEGVYEINVSVMLNDEATTLELAYVQSVAQVTVKVEPE